MELCCSCSAWLIATPLCCGLLHSHILLSPYSQQGCQEAWANRNASSLRQVPLPRSFRSVLRRLKHRPFHGSQLVPPGRENSCSPYQPTPYRLHAAAPCVNTLLLEAFGSFMCRRSPRAFIDAMVKNGRSQHLCLVVYHVHGGLHATGDFWLFLVPRIATRGHRRLDCQCAFSAFVLRCPHVHGLRQPCFKITSES